MSPSSRPFFNHGFEGITGTGGDRGYFEPDQSQQVNTQGAGGRKETGRSGGAEFLVDVACRALRTSFAGAESQRTPVRCYVAERGLSGCLAMAAGDRNPLFVFAARRAGRGSLVRCGWPGLNNFQGFGWGKMGLTGNFSVDQGHVFFSGDSLATIPRCMRSDVDGTAGACTSTLPMAVGFGEVLTVKYHGGPCGLFFSKVEPSVARLPIAASALLSRLDSITRRLRGLGGLFS